jgi:acetyl-CoA carboxylase, biotin carboxylase subunit
MSPLRPDFPGVSRARAGVSGTLSRPRDLAQSRGVPRVSRGTPNIWGAWGAPHLLMFGTVLVANRGEIARRIFRACRRLGIRTVAVFSEADTGSPHTREADTAVLIGPPPARQSYLAIERILEAAHRTGADAVHPGYGFLSENWQFAEACARAGLTFIGPSPNAIRAMGDKTEARRLMRAAGLPIVPGSPGPAADHGEIERIAAEVGFPLILKAAGGGGGIGMARVSDRSELASAYATAARRAQAAFGTNTLYVERYLERPRHVEVQVFGDSHGTLVHLHERECSIQRRHQKLVEESPAPVLASPTRAALAAAAVTGARTIGYENAGTLEFLVDEAGHFYFLEMNTRLQVEHAVTEEVTGLDLVVEQLRVAAGARLSWSPGTIVSRGSAIECRVYAEDPDRAFLPSPGTIGRLELPTGRGVRVESGVDVGSTVSVHYDPLLFKLIVHGDSRAEALGLMEDALHRCRVDGVKTNLSFLRRVIASEAFRAGETHTQMVEEGAFNA